MMCLYDESTLKALKERTPEYLQAVCGITNLRRPFRCLNPSHEDRHPSMSYDQRTNHVKCFSCGCGGDIFEIAGLVENATSFSDKVQAVVRAVGYPLQAHAPTTRKKPVRMTQKPVHDKPRALAEIDLTGEIQKTSRVLLEEPKGKAALDYLHGRGFGNDIIADSCIGWIEHPSVLFPSMKAQQCGKGYLVLGFPKLSGNMPSGAERASYHVSVHYAVFRICETNASPKELKPPGITAPLWREYLLAGICKPDIPVYITEGIFDAMSLATLFGAQACAICGAGTTRLLQVMAHAPKDSRPHPILSFDSDPAGIHLTKTVSSGLQELGIRHSIAKPYPYSCKDANELLMLERGSHE